MFSVDGCILVCTNDCNGLDTDGGDGVGIDNDFKVFTNDINGVGIDDW